MIANKAFEILAKFKDLGITVTIKIAFTNKLKAE
jgi:hypothetical protein